jgi:hypothetical protein
MLEYLCRNEGVCNSYASAQLPSSLITISEAVQFITNFSIKFASTSGATFVVILPCIVGTSPDFERVPQDLRSPRITILSRRRLFVEPRLKVRCPRITLANKEILQSSLSVPPFVARPADGPELNSKNVVCWIRFSPWQCRCFVPFMADAAY